MDLEQRAAAVRLERAVRRAGRPTRVGAGRKILAALALRIVAHGEVAVQQVDLFPIFVDEGIGGVDPRLEAQQARAAARPGFLVEAAGQDLLLDAGRIAGRRLPAAAGVDLVELLV